MYAIGLGWDHNLGLKSFSQCPSPSPFTRQQRETGGFILPVGMPAKGRHTYTQYTP